MLALMYNRYCRSANLSRRCKEPDPRQPEREPIGSACEDVLYLGRVEVVPTLLITLILFSLLRRGSFNAHRYQTVSLKIHMQPFQRRPCVVCNEGCSFACRKLPPKY